MSATTQDSPLLERLFGLRTAGTDARTEVVAGTTTFFAMAYIIFVQPAVLSGTLTGAPTGMTFEAVTAATCLSAALATVIMGWYARYPIALAPGMGQNFFFVVSIVPAAAAVGHPEPWRVALGVIFLSGIAFLALTVVGAREVLIDALSASMKHAIGAGIGLFVAFIGLRNAGIVVADPGTAVALNPDLANPDTLLFGFGLLATAVLQARGLRASLLVGMMSTLAVALLARRFLLDSGAESASSSMLMTQFAPAWPPVAWPASPAQTFLAMDLSAALSLSLVPLIVLVLFMDLFDTLGTLVAVSERAGLSVDGRLERSRQALLADAGGTVAGSLLGTSTVTSYVESAAGVEAGGRTGLTALVVAGLFLLALPFTPLIGAVGSYPPITAPALLLVGALMIRAVRHIEWDDPTEVVPAFVVIVAIPLTYSIADGIALGLIVHPVLKIGAGRGAESSLVGKGLALGLILYFVFARPLLAA